MSNNNTKQNNVAPKQQGNVPKKQPATTPAAKKACQPTGRIDGIVLGDVSFPLFGFRISAKQLKITREKSAVVATRCQ